MPDTRKKMLKEMAIIVISVAVVQISSMFLYLYVRFVWLDWAMHFLGGAFIGLAVIWFLFFSGYTPLNPPNSKYKYIAIALVGTFVVAVLWEIYEYLLGPFFTYGDYVYDTWKDIIMGSLGALVSSIYFLLTKTKK